MENSPKFNFTSLLMPTFIVCLLYFLTLYYWKRRWLYYHTSKLPGPFNFPIIGAMHLFLKGGRYDILDILMEAVEKYAPIAKMWLGSNLYVTTTRPQDLEILLTRCLEKGPVYRLSEDYFKQSLLTAPVKIWREHRKIINPTFSANILHSFIPVFIKQANYLRDSLDENCDGAPKDIFHKIWRFTLATACETIGDVDPDLIEEKDEFLKNFEKHEDILLKRFFNPLYHLDFFWKMSSLGKEVQHISKRARDFVDQMINVKKSTEGGESLKEKRFLNHLLKLQETNKVTHEDILQETPLMLFGSSETSAVVMSSVCIILGLHPEIQEKIFEELDSILADSNRDITREDLNRMCYLERVVKETMRVLPPVPFFFRSIGEDVALDSYVFPAGSHLLVPVAHIHKSKDLWSNPSKFDPDRFLPEEVEKRPNLAYLPFSYGPRNCIATIFRSYKVNEAVDYKKLEDVKQIFYPVAKARKGYRIRFEKRNT